MSHNVKKPGIDAADAVRNASRRRQTGRLILPLVAVAAMIPLATGCASVSKRHFTVGSVKDHYKTRHPIIIDEQEQTLDVPVATNSFDLPLPSKSAVEGFGADFKKSASGTIRVMVPSGSANEKAARRIADKITATLEHEGVPAHRIGLVSYDATQHGATAPIRLSYAAIKASVENCGKWNEDLTQSSQNKNYHNFGCASQNNLAAIVANPADLLGPRGSTNIDAGRRNQVISDYRADNQPTQPNSASSF